MTALGIQTGQTTTTTTRRFNVNGRYIFLVGLILITSVGFSFANHDFYSLVNIRIVLQSISVLLLMSMGMTFIMVTGGIDLSVGSNVAFSGAVGVIVLTQTNSVVLGFLCAILAGMAIGLLNGVFIGVLKLSPFMVTLATFALARGLTLVFMDANSINVTSPAFLWLGATSIGEFPVVIAFIALMYGIFAVVLYRSIYGRVVYAVGTNLNTAALLGRRVVPAVVSVYVLTGFLAGIASVITVGRLSSGQPWAGLDLEFDAITAVILGGTSLFGGRGKLLGTVLGVLLYGVIVNGLILTGANPYIQSLAKGLILLTVVLIDVLFQRGKQA